MNLADYLSELLGQYDEVSVPGLGYFVREHISAYYSESEARFYPPYHRVKFVPELRDDDTFAQYVADKKNISLASSKYFAEKFVTKLREDAAKSKYLFSDLGSFRVEQQQLIFSANEKIAADPSYYGYPPVSIYKQGQPVFGEPARPAFVAPQSAPPVASPQPVHTVLKQEYFEEETERRRPVNIWLIILIVIAALGLAAFGVYKFYPSVFDKLSNKFNKLTGSEQSATDTVTHRHKKINTAYVEPKTIATGPDTASKTIYIVIEGEYPTQVRAQKSVNYLKNHGVPAEIRTDLPGPYVKVSVGVYKTFAKADSAMATLVGAGKISKKSHIDPLIP